MRLSSFVPRSPKDLSQLERRLARAGYHGLMPAVIFSLAELILPVLIGVVVLVLAGLRSGWLLALGCAGVGYLLPGLWLQRLTKARMRVIENGLPDALDLFIVCLEAGSGLDQAVVKATEELALA